MIVILGWGSLVWEPRDLPHYVPWRSGGPTLQLEFSRISSDGRLTLVVDSAAGAMCSTLYAASPRTNLLEAVEDLRRREGTIARGIGWFDQGGDSSRNRYAQQVDVDQTMRDFCATRNVSAVVWTALAANFEEQLGQPFSVDSAMTYLRGLPTIVRQRALEYIRKAPPEIETPLRTRVGACVWPA